MGFTEGLMLRTPSYGGTYVRSLTTVGPCRKRRLARQGVSRVPARALLDLVRELSPDRLLRLHRDLGDAPKRRVVGPLLAVLLQRVGEELRGVAGRAEEHAARSEQASGDGALDRLGRTGVRQTGGERARREPVVGEGDEHGVEDPALARARLAP